MAEETRARIRECAVSIWLKAPVDVLLARVKRKDNRPLLKGGDPREALERLLGEREPTYATADIHFDCEDGPHTTAVENLMANLVERGIWVS